MRGVLAMFSVGDEDPCIRLRLPLPPSVNAMFINVAGRGRAKSALYKQWIEKAGWELKSQRPKKIKGRYDFTALVPENMPGDIDNRLKSLLDLLVTHQIIPDDRHARSVCISRSVMVDVGARVIVHEVAI